MSYAISGILLFLSFIRNNSKRFFYILIIFMFLMFAYSYKTADWGIYLNKFYNYSSVTLRSEPIFGFLNKTISDLGFEFRYFLIFVSGFICFIYYKILKKYNKSCFILALYFIFPFIMEVSQIRFACAAPLIILALIINAKEEQTKKNKILAILLIVIAGLIHYAGLLSLIYLFFNKRSKKETVMIVITILFIMLSLNFLLSKVNYLSGSSSLVNKINFVIKLNADKSTSSLMLSTFRILLFFGGFCFLYFLFVSRKKYDSNKQKFIDAVFKYNCASLLFIPLITYSTDVYRLQQLLAILNYISYSFFLNEKDLIHYPSKIYLRDFVFTLFCVLFAFLSLYFLVLNNDNINTVFKSFFENNIIFGR